MLSFASDFWPLFWAIIGTGAALTVLAVAFAAAGPIPLRRYETATVHHLPRRHHPAATSRKAA
jgi:hypothetical protein